ncbi:MAG: DUF4097 family beta strand repeat protein [Streptosporangiaceae bacterium]|nr:DUF4097 family beta strand repeat protein [Streptosporangiaceae bacterium]MBV9853848.1 DUF4097 family beta strand repeat protein [Streptosporangiaceae bacterium]
MTSALPMTPARRGVLAIGVPIVLALIGFTGFSLVADIGQASYPVSYSIPVGSGRVTMSTGGGDLTVRPGGAAGAGRLAGTVDYSLVRPTLTVNTTSSGTSADFKCHLQIGNCNLDATLEIPARTAVSLSSDGGNLTATGLTGDVTLSTGGGDLTVTGLPGRLRLSTDGGNINGSALTSQTVNAGTGGGDVTLTFASVPRNVQITTSGGNIKVILPHGRTAYNIHATSAGGATNYSSVPQDQVSTQHVITATTGGGDVTITEPS